jgi:hypothetical protein
MKKRGFMASLLSVILAAALFAQSDPLNFVQTGNATHELESDDLVAAHAILPIGQEVLVTNLESGAQVTVTIKERISPSTSRIIDLSTTAAAAVAMFDDNTQVTIEATLKRDESAAVATSAPAPAATPAAAVSASAAAPIQAATPAVPAAATSSASAPAATSAAAAPASAAVATSAPAPAATPAAAAAPASAAPVVAPAPAATPAAASPAAPAVIVVEPAASPSSSGYTPTSEITPVVPPWETGYVPWPAPQNDPWLPELAQPWISGIEREQRSPRIVGPAQAPAPAFAPPPAPAPAQEPAQRDPSARILPSAPGDRDSALYRVQVGAFKARVNAQEAFDRLLNAGFSPVFEVQGGLTRVQIPWVRGREIQIISQRLYSIGFREVWIRPER